MSHLGLNSKEENKLKTICEYLFFDEFKDYATYNRFEQCFQPLFNNISLPLDKVFRSICGEKRKYINYKRFVNAYLLYKNKDPTLDPDLKKFFEILFNSILKEENTFVGKPREKALTYSTPKACKKRECISTIKLLSDKEGRIHGIILEYDNLAVIKLYPNKIEQNLLISLEMKLGLVDENPIEEEKVGKLEGLKEEFYKDAVTHVFGTISRKTEFLSFFGFKCVSGKTVFVGYPEGDGFIFGGFGKKFHEIKIQMTLDGIILIEPRFNINRRTNFYLNTEANHLTKEDLKKDILIQDEVQLSQLTDDIQIDRMITVPIIDDDFFFNTKLSDEISGNDYKEVVAQKSREWIIKTNTVQVQPSKGLLTLEDALKEIEKEKINSQKTLENIEGEMYWKNLGKKKKKKRATNGKLSCTKALLTPKQKLTQCVNNNWIGTNKTLKPIVKQRNYLKNKESYQNLKRKVSQGINDELAKIRGNFSTKKKPIIPSSKKSFAGFSGALQFMKHIKKESIKPKVAKKKTKKDKKLLEKESLSIKKPKVLNVVIIGGSDDTNENNIFCSDDQNLIKEVENRQKISGHVNEGKSLENWRRLGNKVKRLSGPLLLQTIGSVLKATRLLNDEIEGKRSISLEERIKLFKLLEDNQEIVDFISQGYEEEQFRADNIYQKVDSIKEEEEFLIPSQNPEDTTSLPELEKKMSQLDKLLENKDIKSGDKKKLEQLNNLYLQQKNILIENITENAKDEIIQENNIDINKFIQEEQEKRNKAKEESQKKIEEQIKKEQGTAKEEKSINIIGFKDKIKIFRNQEMYKGSEPWTDFLFRPEKSSLCPYNKFGWVLPEDALDDDVIGWHNFEWCRVEEIYDSKNYSVFYEGIQIEDIIQGKICDCYFLSVLGSLCKFPKLIERLFYFIEKTKEHIYGIYFFINGNKKLVLVDDYFPYIGEGFKRFAMSQSEEREIWVSLIEKAWAKINGSYIRIGCGGSPNEVFDVLTEAYSEEVRIKSVTKDELWEKLIDGEKKGFVMTAGTSANEDLEDVGLSPGHAFTVLGIHVINGERVIRLRNPWGEGEFNGDWSNYSSKWTDELKKEYNYSEKQDGDFFIGYKDFLKYFVTIGIAKLHPTFTCTRIKIKKSEAIKCQLIRVTISQDNTLVYFQLYGKNPRIPNKKGVYPKTVLSNLILVDKDFNYLESKAGNNMHICVEQTLKKGEYFLFCDANFRYNEGMENHGYTLTAYSAIDIPMENETETNAVPVLLRKVLIDYCRKKEKANPQKNGVNVYITKSFNKDLPYKVLTFENTSNNNYSVTVGIECKGTKNYCFYCDETASENDTGVVKSLPAKDTIAIIIMYYTLSSIFNFNITIIDAKEQNDPIINHPVFNQIGEEIDEKGQLKQYCLEKDEESYYIGIENSSLESLELMLKLEGLKVKDGPYKGQTAPVFVIRSKERKVFDVIMFGDEDASFKFDFA